MLDPPEQEEVNWNGTAFEKMNNIRILVVRNVQFSTGPTYLPNSLRWLEWEGYPSATLPKDFYPSELIFLKLPRSSYRLREPCKVVTSYVTHLDFSFCEFITEVPDISQCQCLRRLGLAFCDNLIKVHDSLGSLPKLMILDARKCTKLSIFPREMKMASLEDLILTACESLEYFPHVVGKMDALKLISIDGTAIKELPPSLENLSGIRYIYMSSCTSLGELPTSLFRLPTLEVLDFGGVHPHSRRSWMKLMQDMQPIVGTCNMKRLYLMNCGLLDEELHLILNRFRNLRELYLSGNDFVSLPRCIKECTNLWKLNVSDCKRLRDIPELPPELFQIEAVNCTSLTAESLDNLYSQAKKELADLTIQVTATTFPDWFNYCCEGGTLCFRVRGNLPRGVLAFEIARKANMSREKTHFPVFMSINGVQIMKQDFDYKWQILAQQGDLLLLDGFMQFTEEEQRHVNKFMGLDWNEVKIHMTRSPDTSIAKCGVYFYKETNMENVQFKSSHASTASLEQRVMASSPNYERPKKILRTN
ncbi:disease resistance protein TAO1-like isoform X2 [Neltuma alba]|nr:disease resistance protein TAO1-like isoform X2 [Prosopis alba]